jgi:hypothetical protein
MRSRHRRTGLLAWCAGVVLAMLASIALWSGATRMRTDRVRIGPAAPERMSTLGVPGRSSATPWVAARDQFVAVVWGASTEQRKADIFLAISRDSGATFSRPVQVNTQAGEARLGGELPPRVALKPKTSGDPDVVVLWTASGATTGITLARSTDAGRTFGPAIRLQALDAPGDRGWPSLAVDDGGVHAIWLDHRGLAEMTSRSDTNAVNSSKTAAQSDTGPRSTPGSQNAANGRGNHQHKPGMSSPLDGVAMAQRSGLYYGRVPAAVPETTSVAAAPAERELAKGVCYCCKTAFAAGRDGTLFAAWRQVYEGNIRDIAFAVSRDGGRTFGPPVRASEDLWEIHGCPDDGPAMVVDGSGDIHLVWPTVVTGEEGEPAGALFYASTRDGRTFTPRQRVPTLGGPRPMHPQIVVDQTGEIAIAWDELVNDQRVASLRTVTRGARGAAAFGPVVTLDERAPAQYPALAATNEGILAVWTSGAAGSSTIAIRRLDLRAMTGSAP